MKGGRTLPENPWRKKNRNPAKGPNASENGNDSGKGCRNFETIDRISGMAGIVPDQSERLASGFAKFEDPNLFIPLPLWIWSHTNVARQSLAGHAKTAEAAIEVE